MHAQLGLTMQTLAHVSATETFQVLRAAVELIHKHADRARLVVRGPFMHC